ncbi:DUF7673 family protein [Sinorhizobium chiapasense]|uniref:DUF7673 domain-containing protein n=1 Tax=Sinorhizobium chiapasense TaxID=501572 RepID=A0ABZ2BFM5_9HYPH
MDDETRFAFEKLLNVAHGESGQSGRVAGFLLAWWNAEANGGFDLADLFTVDREIAGDMTTVFAYLARCEIAEYPTDYRGEIEQIIARWRPSASAE